MKLISTTYAQASRMLGTYYPSGGIYLLEAIKGLKERYGFVKVPASLEECDFTKGVVFRHGKFQSESLNDPRISGHRGKVEGIVIDQLQIFTTGVLVETQTFSEDASLFLDNLIDWGIDTFGLTVLNDPPVRNSLTSHVEVQLNIKLDSLFDKFGKLIETLGSHQSEYGPYSANFKASGLSFACDMFLTPQGNMTPNRFVIERSATRPFDSSVFFSMAPLKTADHLELLEVFEKLVG